MQAVRIGEGPIRKMIQGELAVLKQDTVDLLGNYPTLIGEIGIPYDMVSSKFDPCKLSDLTLSLSTG